MRSPRGSNGTHSVACADDAARTGRSPSTTNAPPSPVLDFKIFEASEILSVERDEDEAVGMSDRGGLPVHVRRGPAKSLETGSFVAVPRRGNLVVRNDRK